MAESIICTMTTLPSRLIHPSFERCISSILNQWYSNFELHLNIPTFSELERTRYELPEFLEVENRDKRIHIYRDVKDDGPSTKLYPTLHRVDDPNTIIVTFDDDIIYHPNTLFNHMYYRNNCGRCCAIGFAGLNNRLHNIQENRFVTTRTPGEIIDVITLEGYKSLSVERHFFDDDYMTYRNITWDDDLTLSAYLEFKKIEKKVVGWKDNNVRWGCGGVESYPILATINYGSDSGCNTRRKDPNNDESKKAAVFFKQLGWL